MGKKNKDLQEILDQLSEKELTDLEELIGKASNKPRHRRRGKGKRKNKKLISPTSNPDNFLDGVKLSGDEQQELAEASKFDKEKGVDKPNTHDIMHKGHPFTKVQIQCMDCKKTFDIAPSLIPPERDRFKCNSCICRGRDRS